jgi:phage terminase small subunit
VSKRKRTTTKQVQANEDKPFVAPQLDVKPETDEGEWDNDCLTIRQRQFVEALVGPAGGNATLAAEMAGYKSDNRITLAATACENLGKPYVQEAIARALARKRMTPEWTTERLFELASTSMRNFVHVGSDGEIVVDWKQAAAVGAIGQIGEVTEEILKTEGGAKTISRKFKLHNPAKALETILKLTGRLVETHNVNVNVDLSKLSDDDLRQLREIHSKLGNTGRSGLPASTN